MPRLSFRSTALNSSHDDRVFTDDKGRTWNAVNTGEAIVFTCISDGRQSGRAIAVESSLFDNSVSDATLRAWLNAAPRIGTLS